MSLHICSAGHGGPVLLSATTAALVSGALPDGVSQRDLGSVRLKDLDEPEQAPQLVIDGLPEDFPPLRVASEEPMASVSAWRPRSRLTSSVVSS